MPASPAPVDLVIFDLGRVLLDYDWRTALAGVVQDTGLAPDVLHDRLFHEAPFYAFERGDISPEEFHAAVERVLETPLQYGRFMELWNSIFSAEIEPTATLARALERRGRPRVALLSNTNITHIEHVRKKFKILGDFKHVFLSYELRARKPEPPSYLKVLEALHAKPEHTVFVDDMERNIVAAEKLGIRGVLASSPEAVAAGLRAAGVEI
jgi:HAD superfamily hydrolase (TIGR01509 family)